MPISIIVMDFARLGFVLGNICGDYGVSVAFGAGSDPSHVCKANVRHTGLVDPFSMASVSIWYLVSSSADPNIECHFWCSGNGTAFEVGHPLTGPIDEKALQDVVSPISQLNR